MGLKVHEHESNGLLVVVYWLYDEACYARQVWRQSETMGSTLVYSAMFGGNEGYVPCRFN